MSNKYPGGFVSLGGPLQSYSYNFKGTSNYYLTIPSSQTPLNLSTGDFTVECWINMTDVSKLNIVFSTGSTWQFGYEGASGGRKAYVWNSGDVMTSTYTPLVSANTWQHIAWTRSGTTMYLFLNGTLVASTTNSSAVDLGGAYIGTYAPNTSAYPFYGYISNLRVVKGTALYTASFTVPASPYTAISGTSLLTCQSSTFVDNSSNGYTITVVGSVVTSTTQPNFQAYNPNNLDPALGAATPGVWTLSQAMAAEVNRSWPMYDPYYNNVVLNLHGNGANAGQNNTFLDSGPNALTITRNGNTTQGSFSPYGNNLYAYFGGLPAGHYTNQSVLSNSGNFTLECWANVVDTSITNYCISSGQYLTGTSGPNCQLMLYTGGEVFFYMNGFSILTVGAGIQKNTWAHIAAVRSGTTITVYVNGIARGSGTSSDRYDVYCLGAFFYNNDSSSYQEFNGYLSNVRLTNTAVYSANFTPPTSNLTAISGTQLLTFQNGSYKDNSANNYTITPYGGVAMERCTFSPFTSYPVNTAYGVTTTGGSAYFDGSGDYLTTPYSTTDFDWYTAGTDYTIEAWIYPTTLTGWSYNTGSGDQSSLIGDASPSTTANYWSFGPTSTGTVRFYYYDSVAGQFGFVSTATVKVGQWNHIAMVKTSAGINILVNGVGTGASAIVGTPVSSAVVTLTVGQINGTNIAGYVGDIRIVKGTAVYSGTTYTVPTAPLTAITNTKLLLSMTNAAIFDNAMVMDFETVGDAQVSTSVKKYGSGSMKFDGSGDALRGQYSPMLQLGNVPFTLECWVNPTAVSTYDADIVSNYQYANTTSYILIFKTNQTIQWYAENTDASSTTVTTTAAISIGAWTHIAVVRNAGVLTIYLNGVSAATVADTKTYKDIGSPITLGAPSSGGAGSAGDYFNGYIDDLRITKGVARYLGPFTPPTSQLQDQ